MSSAENEPVALWSRVKQASGALRAMPVEQRAHAIARACTALGTPDGALLRRLSLSAGLSEPMTRWALNQFWCSSMTMSRQRSLR